MNESKWKEAQESWTELFYAEDPEADYSFDDIVLFNKGEQYALFFDSGCSCSSPFEDNPGGDVYTKPQLLKLMSAWKGDRTEAVMKEWILENIHE
ncbi:DUF7574 domain-containing protein [Rhodococcus qingshengii]|uniref:DUF7574 domain-containing protein n=1 Tax=Rhodococcus qingshengii TaxID=334542 RepID=UPI0030199FB9